VSIDIGSVRLSDRILTDRPPSPVHLDRAREHVLDLFSDIEDRGELIGVAGTWTNLAGMDLDLPLYDRERIHLHRVSVDSVVGITEHLARLTVAETKAIPSLDPGRAPMILAGAVVAQCVMDTLAAPHVIVSERDTLDGLAMELLGLT
jgi:exopolyphosphatase/guanosine-5'-triphosphate,3'-diphosphate pyrophosphatase